jgi:hypothetical protein
MKGFEQGSETNNTAKRIKVYSWDIYRYPPMGRNGHTDHRRMGPLGMREEKMEEAGIKYKSPGILAQSCLLEA